MLVSRKHLRTYKTINTDPTTAEEHIGFHSCQLRTGSTGHRLTEIGPFRKIAEKNVAWSDDIICLTFEVLQIGPLYGSVHEINTTSLNDTHTHKPYSIWHYVRSSCDPSRSSKANPPSFEGPTLPRLPWTRDVIFHWLSLEKKEKASAKSAA